MIDPKPGTVECNKHIFTEDCYITASKSIEIDQLFLPDILLYFNP